MFCHQSPITPHPRQLQAGGWAASGSAVAITTIPLSGSFWKMNCCWWDEAEQLLLPDESPADRLHTLLVIRRVCHGASRRSAEDFGMAWIRPFGSVCVCVHRLYPPASPPIKSHLKSQPAKIWPFLTLQLEFFQRHIKNRESCFTLSCFGVGNCSEMKIHQPNAWCE